MRQHLYDLLRVQYEIKNPYFVFKRMKNKTDLAYDPEQDRFQLESRSEEPESIFMSMEELCSPVMPRHMMSDMEQLSFSRPEAMEKLVRELIGDRLLELSRYVALDSLLKTMIIDKTSLESDGYQLITHWTGAGQFAVKKQDVEIIAGAVCADHVHLNVAIPPKLSVFNFMGY